MTTRKPVLIGPFSRGVNTYDDPTAIHDQECAEALNFDPGLDGSLRSRPPFTDTGDPLQLGPTGTPRLLGYFYDTNGVPYLIAADGASSTWRYFQGIWTIITDTFSATDMAQFDGKAWLVAPVGSSASGGSWTPSGGFVADANMPKGTSIESYKSRLWIAEGVGGANSTRVRYSKVLGQTNFWTSPAFMDVGSGDGQGVVKLLAYFDTLLIFRTKSIWSLTYATDPALAIQGVVVPGVGLQGRHALAVYENYLYFMYDSKAYEFVNNRVQQINVKIPFKTSNPGSTSTPYTVSLFNNRILYSYYENIYVYSLRTQTWTTWRSDLWGPIGQVLSPIVDDDADLAYAMPSAAAAAEAITARNRVLNPSFKNNTQYWGASTGTPALTRVSSTTPGHDFHLRVTSVTATGAAQARMENTPVTPGEKLSFRLSLRTVYAGNPAKTVTVGVNNIQGGTEGAGNGTIITGFQSQTYEVSGDWVDVDLTDIEVYEGATYVRLYVAFNVSGIGDHVDVDTVRMDIAPAGGGPLSKYLDGDTESADPNIAYRWLGAIGNSPSVEVTNRMSTLLQIEDAVTAAKEPMQCILVTKNYNFDVPGSFKVLFWWGVDAIFKVGIKGEVIPGVYNLSTTWGALRTNAVGWATVLGGTWAHPYLSDPTVESEVTTSPGPPRKFVKFFKKLRFRQVYFRVTFQIDGSFETAPVQVFTLSTYMSEKQTVSKTVS